MQRWAEISTATKNQSHQAILFAILNLGSENVGMRKVYGVGERSHRVEVELEGSVDLWEVRMLV